MSDEGDFNGAKSPMGSDDAGGGEKVEVSGLGREIDDISDLSSDLSELSDLDVDEDFAKFDETNNLERELDVDALKSLGKHRRQLTEEERSQKKREATRQERDGKRKRIPAADDEEETVERAAPAKIMTSDERRKAELDERINAAIKPNRPKKKKKNEIDVEKQQDEMIENLKNRMTLAAKRDADDNEQKRPAIHKLHMLPEVLDVFAKKALVDSILENNLLEAVRFWLEPLPDKSLPAYNIQRELFSILQQLPIKPDALRQSGLGKVVVFYTKDVRPESHIRRTAERLVREWSRPILGKSDNYRHRLVQTADYRPSGNKPKVLSSLSQEKTDALATPNLKPNRTRIPQTVPLSYDIAPVNKLDGSRPAAVVDDNLRKMKARLLATGKKGKGRL